MTDVARVGERGGEMTRRGSTTDLVGVREMRKGEEEIDWREKMKLLNEK